MNSENKNEYVLVIGANSDIGFAIAEKFYNKGFNLILATRNINDLKTRTSKFDEQRFYSTSINTNETQNMHTWISELPHHPIVAVNAIGYLGDQELARSNWQEASEIIRINFTSQAVLLNEVAELFKRQQKGCIICISSMAGERGRQSNFMYGSAKAGLTAYLSGLRQYLHPFGVHVITVIPGFVKTKMTSHLPLPERLTTTPEKLASRIFNAYKSKRNVIYSSFSWWLISLIIKHIPEVIYKRLKL